MYKTVDLGMYWEWLEASGNLLDSLRRAYGSCNPWADNRDIIGLCGEAAFSLYFGLPVVVAINPHHGDGGTDLTMIDGRTVDIKSTKYCLLTDRGPNLLQEHASRWADYYVLVAVSLTGKTAVILGAASKDRLRAAPLRDFGFGPRHALLWNELDDVETIRKALVTNAEIPF